VHNIVRVVWTDVHSNLTLQYIFSLQEIYPIDFHRNSENRLHLLHTSMSEKNTLDTQNTYSMETITSQTSFSVSPCGSLFPEPVHITSAAVCNANGHGRNQMNGLSTYTALEITSKNTSQNNPKDTPKNEVREPWLEPYNDMDVDRKHKVEHVSPTGKRHKSSNPTTYVPVRPTKKKEKNSLTFEPVDLLHLNDIRQALFTTEVSDDDMMRAMFKHDYMFIYAPIHVRLLSELLTLSNQQVQLLDFFSNHYHSFKCAFLLERIDHFRLGYEMFPEESVFVRVKRKLLVQFDIIDEKEDLMKWCYLKDMYNSLRSHLKGHIEDCIKSKNSCITQPTYKRTHNNIRTQMDYHIKITSFVLASLDSLFIIYEY